MTAADVARLAELAYAEVMASKPRTPERRAAVAVYYSATVGKPKTLAAVRRAITDTYPLPDTQQAALELLDRLTAQLGHEGPAVQVGQQGQEQTA